MSISVIPIKKEIIGGEEVNSVSARELWKNLGVKKKFADWINQQINSLYLSKGVDYELVPLKVKQVSGTKHLKEYIISLDTAKHIAMASRTPKGKEIRSYFIEVEKAYKKGANSLLNEQLIKDIASVVAQVVAQSIEPLAKLIAENNEIMRRGFRDLQAKSSVSYAESFVGVAPEYMPPAEAKRNRARKWSPEEVDAMLTLSEDGYTSAQIGYKLNRSAMSVRLKRYRVIGKWID